MSTITANMLQSVDETHQLSVAELDVIAQNIKTGAYADKQTSTSDVTAGRLLVNGAFGLPLDANYAALPRTTAVDSITDLNTIITGGWWGKLLGGNAGSRNLNHPDGQTAPAAGNGVVNYYHVFVVQHTTSAVQVAYPYIAGANTSQATIKFRILNDGTWTAWASTWHSANLVKTTSSADTTAGSLMKVGDFGLGVSVLTTDLNNAILPGFYKNADSCANAPTTGIGTTTVNSFDSGSVTQIWIERSSGDMYARSIISSAPVTWSAWKLMVSIDPGTGALSVTAFNATEINANFFSEKVQAAANSTVDVGLGSYITYTATGANTWSFSTAGINSGYAMSWTLELTNGGLGLQTFTGVKWPGGVAPTLTAAGVDILVFTKLSTGVVRGYLAGADSK